MLRLGLPNSSDGDVDVIVKHVIRYIIPRLLKPFIIEKFDLQILVANISLCMMCTLPGSIGGSSKHFVEDLTENHTNFIVIGDLNARYVLWRNPTCNKNGNLLTDYLGTGEYNRESDLSLPS